MKYIKGNLITLAQQGMFDVIVHGCNCHCTMGSGIAPQIARAFPEAEKVDKETSPGEIMKLGHFTEAISKNAQGKELRVINAYTQYGFGGERAVDYGAVISCFERIHKQYHVMEMNSNKKYKFGIPKIGAGLGGGDWGLISKIIDSCAPNLDITCVEYVA